MQSLVSILIPCFNCAPWVDRAIETALAQTWANKEVIVLDDGSTDGSIDVIRKFAKEVRIEKQINGGQNVSRNRLTELSRGDWLVYLDADDELATDSLEKKMAMSNGADAVYGTIEVASFAGVEKTRSTFYPAPSVKDPIVAAFNWAFPNTSAFLFRKDAIVKAGGWNTAIKNCTDYDMYFRLLLNDASFRPAPDAVSLYRQWSLTQAVYESPLRKARGRLELMQSVAVHLANTGRLTEEREDAFEQATFGVARMIAQFDYREASRIHARLKEQNPGFFPKTASCLFQAAYRLLGFGFAERLAKTLRKVNPAAKTRQGIDPASGLPYV